MEIYRFSKWRPSAMLDFRNLTFSSSNLCAHAIMPPNSKFRLNRTIWSRVIAKKIFNMASVRHLEFGNFRIFLTFPQIRSKFASAYQISSYSDDSRLRYGYRTIFKMAAVRHVGFIVTSSYCAGRLKCCFLTPNTGCGRPSSAHAPPICSFT